MNPVLVTVGPTFEDLVRAVQDTARSDAEVVAVIRHLLNKRRVAFRRRLRPAPCGMQQAAFDSSLAHM